jgi:hypothetical protein
MSICQKNITSITAIGTDNRTHKNHIITHHSIIDINISTGLIHKAFFIKTGVNTFSCIRLNTYKITTINIATKNELYNIATTNNNIQVNIGHIYGMISRSHAITAIHNLFGISTPHHHIITNVIHTVIDMYKLNNNLAFNQTAKFLYTFSIFNLFTFVLSFHPSPDKKFVTFFLSTENNIDNVKNKRNCAKNVANPDINHINQDHIREIYVCPVATMSLKFFCNEVCNCDATSLFAI